MSRIACKPKRSRTFELGVALHGKAGFLCASLTVAECVDCALGEFNTDALSVADVDGCAVGIVQRQTIEYERHLVLSIHVERAVLAAAAQCINQFALHIFALYNANMSTVHCDGKILGNVASDLHSGCFSVIHHIHGIVQNFVVRDKHAVNVGERIHLI